jgi:hypothetical protein
VSHNNWGIRPSNSQHNCDLTQSTDEFGVKTIDEAALVDEYVVSTHD